MPRFSGLHLRIQPSSQGLLRDSKPGHGSPAQVLGNSRIRELTMMTYRAHFIAANRYEGCPHRHRSAAAAARCLKRMGLLRGDKIAMRYKRLNMECTRTKTDASIAITRGKDE